MPKGQMPISAMPTIATRKKIKLTNGYKNNGYILIPQQITKRNYHGYGYEIN